MNLSLPNSLTIFRIFVIPLIVVLFYLPFSWAPFTTALLFAIACITDWLDGYLARALNQTSAFGRFLDPVADKLIVAVVIVLLVSDHNLAYLSLPAAVIIGREIMISALREWMAEIGKRASIAVSFVGKVKTVLQMIALIILLWVRDFGSVWLTLVGYAFFYASAILTLWSMFMYLKAAWSDLKNLYRSTTVS